MSKEVVVLRTPEARARARRLLDLAPDGARVTFAVSKRSLGQNDLLYGLLGDLSEQVEWHGQKLSSTDWKTMMTAGLRGYRVVPGIDGGSFVPLGMSTSEMTKEEMSDLIELIYHFGSERGVVFFTTPEKQR